MIADFHCEVDDTTLFWALMQQVAVIKH